MCSTRKRRFWNFKVSLGAILYLYLKSAHTNKERCDKKLITCYTRLWAALTNHWDPADFEPPVSRHLCGNLFLSFFFHSTEIRRGSNESLESLRGIKFNEFFLKLALQAAHWQTNEVQLNITSALEENNSFQTCFWVMKNVNAWDNLKINFIIIHILALSMCTSQCVNVTRMARYYAIKTGLELISISCPVCLKVWGTKNVDKLT